MLDVTPALRMRFRVKKANQIQPELVHLQGGLVMSITREQSQGQPLFGQFGARGGRIARGPL